ncbi:Predicted protein [uncultured Eubacteriales bacterium]|uniref:PTS EIIA type-4 domain-containing protein n=1 Tax=uncultured Eubacteriales bacterium TaxID=172733 RepID=A0A212K861_9FIRM|nr:Predicted protein [uncultured Eubacteriales bacterium]
MEMNEIPAIVCLSHGPFCQALADTAQVIYGKAEALHAIVLEEGMDPENYMEKVEELIARYSEKVFFLVDIQGGTPYNCLMRAARKHRLHAIAGANVPILLELLATRDICPLEELADAVMANAGESVGNLDARLEHFFGM